MRHLRLVWLLLCTLVIGISGAQTFSCPEIVQRALESANRYCEPTGRNQACYGNVLLHAQPFDENTGFRFSDAGDIEDLARIQSMRLSPLNEATGDWGVAILRVQATIPNTLPGQNVTFVLFGDVAIQNASQPGQNPMQAFYVQSGIGRSTCEEAPRDGLLIQTPQGVEHVTFNVNGVDVQVGSTVFLQAAAGEQMKVTTMEGSALIEMGDEWYPVFEGTSVEMPMDDGLLPSAAPSKPVAYEIDDLAMLPVDLLERDIEIAPPMSEDAITFMISQMDAGQLPCGMDGLPACEELDADLRWASSDQWGMVYIPGETCTTSDAPSPDLATCPEFDPVPEFSTFFNSDWSIDDEDDGAIQPDESTSQPEETPLDDPDASETDVEDTDPDATPASSGN